MEEPESTTAPFSCCGVKVLICFVCSHPPPRPPAKYLIVGMKEDLEEETQTDPNCFSCSSGFVLDLSHQLCLVAKTH